MQFLTSRVTRVLTAAVIALGFAVFAHAQAINTAPLSGVVQNASGQPIAGARVTITHQPTASVTTEITDSKGVFTRLGLRPGGPYTVEVSISGMAPAKVENINLNAETGAFVPVTVGNDVVQMEKFSVTASARSTLFDPNATDTSSFVSNQDIQNMVKGDRTLGSLLANDPRIIYNRNPGQQYISASGINNRYNQIMVDGVPVDDPFGLNTNGMAAQTNVIPIEALESVALSTTPYNARKGGFTGASITAVSKSGGNEFHGSVYYTFRSSDLVGEHLNDKSYPLASFKEQTYGFTLGGPIIPKKLFFFGAIEQRYFNQPIPTPTYSLDASTMNQIVDGISALNAGVAANGNVINTGASVPFTLGSVPFPYTYTGTNPTGASQVLANTTGNPGTRNIKDTTALGKLEWQVDENNRITLGYQYSIGTRPTYPGFATSSASSINNFSVSNSWYNLTKKNYAITGAWTSHWSDKLYTEVNLGYSRYDSSNDNNPIQPYIQIQGVPVRTGTLTPSGTSNSAYVTMGTDYSYQLNSLTVKTKNAEAFASYKLNDSNTFDAGVQFKTNDVYNIYVQYNAGYYIFNSLAAFTSYASGTSQAIYTYRNNFLVPGVDPAANFREGNLGVFIRDVLRASRNLTFDLNLRLDNPIVNTAPAFNQAFFNAFGMRNDYTYDGQMVLQPRIGFNWQPKINDGKLKTVIRGGAGLFYGGMPRVWLGNSFSNTGFNYGSYWFSGTSPTTPNYPVFSSDPNNQPSVGTAPTQTVNVIAPNFKLPSRWKGNITFEQELPWLGMKFAVDVEGSKVEHDVVYKAINLKQNGAGPDGRPLYWNTYNVTTGTGSGQSLVNSNFSSGCMEMLNTNLGHTAAVTLSLQRPMKADGWQWMVAYTNTQTVEATYNNSSVASSNWNGRTVWDPNVPVAHRGDGEIRNRYLVTITKKLDIFSFGSSFVTLTYNGRNGLPYSVVAYNDVNGDGQYNDILYVPNYSETSIGGTTPYVFNSEADRVAFYKMTRQLGLKEGAAAPINGQRYPWVHQFDLHLSQEVKLPGWRHSLELAVDVLNIGNMLNNKWGVVYGVDENYVKTTSLATVTYNNNTKQYTYTAIYPTNFVFNTPWLDKSYTGEPAASRWSVLLSAKYKF